MNNEELGARAELRSLFQEAAKVAHKIALTPAEFLLAAASGWNYGREEDRLSRRDLYQVLERYEGDPQDEELEGEE